MYNHLFCSLKSLAKAKHACLDHWLESSGGVLLCTATNNKFPGTVAGKRVAYIMWPLALRMSQISSPVIKTDLFMWPMRMSSQLCVKLAPHISLSDRVLLFYNEENILAADKLRLWLLKSTTSSRCRKEVHVALWRMDAAFRMCVLTLVDNQHLNVCTLIFEHMESCSFAGHVDILLEETLSRRSPLF